MKDIIIFAAFIAVAIYGFFIMKQVDKFLEENRKAIAGYHEAKERPYIVFREIDDYEEMQREIERFRKTHSDTCVLLYDSTRLEDMDFDELYDD